MKFVCTSFMVLCKNHCMSHNIKVIRLGMLFQHTHSCALMLMKCITLQRYNLRNAKPCVRVLVITLECVILWNNVVSGFFSIEYRVQEVCHVLNNAIYVYANAKGAQAIQICFEVRRPVSQPINRHMIHVRTGGLRVSNPS